MTITMDEFVSILSSRGFRKLDDPLEAHKAQLYYFTESGYLYIGGNGFGYQFSSRVDPEQIGHLKSPGEYAKHLISEMFSNISEEFGKKGSFAQSGLHPDP